MGQLPETHLKTTARRCDLYSPCGNINRDPHTVGCALCNFALLYTDGLGGEGGNKYISPLPVIKNNRPISNSGFRELSTYATSTRRW